jgi:membrane-associated protease RseP (regulator of RpoE activity)
MSANIAVLVLVSLATAPSGWNLSAGIPRRMALSLLVGGLGCAGVASAAFSTLQPTGLLGLFIFLAVLSLSVGIMVLLQSREEQSTLTGVTAVPALPS